MVSSASAVSRRSRLCAFIPRFSSAGVPSAITLPAYISARRLQYSASSM